MGAYVAPADALSATVLTCVGVQDRGHERDLPNCIGHIDLMHEAPSGHRRCCGHIEDTFPSRGGAILSHHLGCVGVGHLLQL